MTGVLVLSGCAGAEDVPDPGPLEVGAPASCLISGSAAEIEVDAGAVSNQAEIPLTIDSVELEKPRNIALLDASLLPDGNPGAAVPAVDATVPEKTEDGAMTLRLRLRVRRPAEPASFGGFEVEYHNVEGRFSAITRCS